MRGDASIKNFFFLFLGGGGGEKGGIAKLMMSIMGVGMINDFFSNDALKENFKVDDYTKRKNIFLLEYNKWN